jgi:myo-inositol-1(or 4)-monophosphatase
MSGPLLDVAVQAARAGGSVLRQGLERDLTVEEKEQSRSSIVTWADLRSQEEIARVIGAAFPDHAVRGEEGDAGAPDGEHVWYVDPVDGTTNYSHGFPCYCVSVAVVTADRIAAGVVYDPFREDLFAAECDGPATHNDVPMRVAPTAELRASLLSTQVQSDDPEGWARYLSRARAFLEVGRAVRSIGSPALAMAYVARGWLDCFCEEAMAPWDTLAATLLVERAGGQVTAFDGSDRPLATASDVLASNGLLHEQLIAVLNEAVVV